MVFVGLEIEFNKIVVFFFEDISMLPTLRKKNIVTKNVKIPFITVEIII